jgi:NAD(P)-dependent dehydrogenase (short-subunit alcohol dehydrogenase family)
MERKSDNYPASFPPQVQSRRPGIESEMAPQPADRAENYRGSGKLEGKVAIITGGDSGIGRAVALHFSKEGAKVVVSYLDEHGDAEETKRLVEASGGECELVPGDVGDEKHCKAVVARAVERFGQLDVLVNNAGEQHPQKSIADISEEQLDRTFRTNLFAMFFLVKAALLHLKEGSSIINTASVTTYEGSPSLLDYSSTKGAILAFTRSLALNLAEKKIRVNAVAPGPIWTPLIVSTFDAEKVATFGQDTPMKRAGQPDEVAPSFVFLASEDGSYMTGQTLHPDGGDSTSS